MEANKKCSAQLLLSAEQVFGSPADLHLSLETGHTISLGIIKDECVTYVECVQQTLKSFATRGLMWSKNRAGRQRKECGTHVSDADHADVFCGQVTVGKVASKSSKAAWIRLEPTNHGCESVPGFSLHRSCAAGRVLICMAVQAN